MNYTYARKIADYLQAELAESCLPGYCRVAGSVRREKADCGDLELVVIPHPGYPRPAMGQKHPFTSHLEAALDRLRCEGRLGGRKKDGPRQKQIVIKLETFGIKTLNSFYLDLYIVRPETWGVLFTLRTGCAEFSQRCVTSRSVAGFGFLPEDCKYIVGETRIERNGVTVPLPEEKDFFDLLGLGWVEPRERNKEFRLQRTL